MKTISKNAEKLTAMRNIWYVIAVVLIVGWAIGLFGFHLGPIIHVLLVTAVIVIILRTFGEKKAI